MASWPPETLIPRAELQVCPYDGLPELILTALSGDFGDFASFVTHMKAIAEVCQSLFALRRGVMMTASVVSVIDHIEPFARIPLLWLADVCSPLSL